MRLLLETTTVYRLTLSYKQIVIMGLLSELTTVYPLTLSWLASCRRLDQEFIIGSCWPQQTSVRNVHTLDIATISVCVLDSWCVLCVSGRVIGGLYKKGPVGGFCCCSTSLLVSQLRSDDLVRLTVSWGQMIWSGCQLRSDDLVRLSVSWGQMIWSGCPQWKTENKMGA